MDRQEIEQLLKMYRKFEEESQQVAKTLLNENLEEMGLGSLKCFKTADITFEHIDTLIETVVFSAYVYGEDEEFDFPISLLCADGYCEYVKEHKEAEIKRKNDELEEAERMKEIREYQRYLELQKKFGK